MVILDVWGGERNMVHVARYIIATKEAVSLALHEVESGFLVNLRKELNWGEYINFDTRIN